MITFKVVTIFIIILAACNGKETSDLYLMAFIAAVLFVVADVLLQLIK